MHAAAAVPAPALRRSLAGATIALALLGQVAGVLHMGVVRHERCDEHGELVERGATVAVDVDGETHGDAADRHDHCVVGDAPAHRRAEAPTLVVVDLASRPLEVARAPVADARAPAVAVFRTAPKGSPPAA